MILPWAQSTSAPRLDAKRGDTLALDCAVDADLTGWAVRAQIRAGNDALLAECVVTGPVYDLEDAVTRYVLTVDAAVTAAWPAGTAGMDIEYTDPFGVVQSTETVLLVVRGDVTR
jgi:hypothetical protein